VRKRPGETIYHEDEMVRICKRKPLVGLLLLVVVALSAGCPGDDPGEPVEDVLIQIETVEEIEIAEEDILVPPIPKLVIKVRELEDQPCDCPAAGWCAVTGSNFDIFVGVDLLNKPDGGFAGITNVSLVHTGFDGEENVIDSAKSTTTHDDDQEDYYALYFQKEEIDTGIEDAHDGIHELTVKVETDVIYTIAGVEVPLRAEKTITVMVDTTPPTVLKFKLDPDNPEKEFSFQEPMEGGVYAQYLPAKYCLQDKHPDGAQDGAGLALETATFSLVEGEETTELDRAEGPVPKCPLSKALQFDVAQNNTATYEFKLEVEDCVGNVGVASVPDITVVGLPNYDVPAKDPFDGLTSSGLGKVSWTRPVHIGTKDGEQVYVPDDYPDLVLFGEAGIAFAMNDGNGNIMPPVLVHDELIAVDGYAWDVNEDDATDLVVLTTTADSSFLEVHLQDVLWDEEDKSWVPNGTFPPPDSELIERIELGSKPFTMMDRFDVNGDGFDDLLVVGPDDEETGVLLLHTKELIPYPEEGANPKADKPKNDKNEDLYVTDAPIQPNHFVIQDKVQGIGGISDAYIGQFRSDGSSNLGPPEVVVVRPDHGLLTVIPLDQEFKFGSAVDTVFCWGSASMIAKPAELRRVAGEADKETSEIWHHPNAPKTEDLLVYSDTTTSLHFLPNKGNGQFDLLGKYYHCGFENCPKNSSVALCALAGDDQYDEEEGFGQQHVAGSLAFLFGEQSAGQSDYGYVAYVGETPDGLWLGDIAVSPVSNDEGPKDGIVDIIVPVTGRNYVAFHPGVAVQGEEAGQYGYGTRGNPGEKPRSCTVADFDLDNVLDVLCITSTQAGPDDEPCESCEGSERDSFSQFSSTSTFLPYELPLPLSVDWQAGTVVPTHLLVADLEEDFDNDIVVATAPETMYLDTEGEWLNTWNAEGMDSASVPMILAYRLESGIQETDLPDVSPVDLDFNQELSAVAAGDFNQDGNPDLAISIDASAATACDGRTVDILIGNTGLKGTAFAEGIGANANSLSMYGEEAVAKGQFLPLGGFLLLQSVTGLMTAKLNNDNIDDLIVFAKEYSTPGADDYQPHQIATYLTIFDSDWNTCAGNLKRPYFDWAPVHAIQGIDLPACGAELPEIPGEDDDGIEYTCWPEYHINKAFEGTPYDEATFELFSEYGDSGLLPGQARPSMATAQYEAGDSPVAGTTGDFFSSDGSGADGCIDFFVANAGTHNATFVRGVCVDGNYLFESPVYLFPIGEDPLDIKTADLNHDDHVDTVAALSDQISLMYGVSGELFDSPQYLNKGGDFQNLAPTQIEVEDVNDDGWVDLLVISSSHDSVLVYLNGGVSESEKLLDEPHRTRFLGPYTIPVGVNPTSILVAPIFTDLNLDESEDCNDLAVLNAGSGTITLLRNLRCVE